MHSHVCLGRARCRHEEPHEHEQNAEYDDHDNNEEKASSYGAKELASKAESAGDESHDG
jgi:hypothetical protein